MCYYYFFVTQDMHGKTETGLTPEKDVSQDYELLASFQNGSHISVVFRRAWDTCDAHNDVVFGVCIRKPVLSKISFESNNNLCPSRVYRTIKTGCIM